MRDNGSGMYVRMDSTSTGADSQSMLNGNDLALVDTVPQTGAGSSSSYGTKHSVTGNQKHRMYFILLKIFFRY
jgi:hypothetical protein